MKHIFSLVMIAVVGVSCVSQKKYDDLLVEKVALEQEKYELEAVRDELTGRVDSLSEAIARVSEELNVTAATLDSLESAHADLKAEYNKLDTYYNNLLSNSGRLSRDLEEQRKSLLALRSENEALSKDLAIREARVAELEQVLAEKDSAVNALKNIVSDALLNFAENDLSVEVRNGKVYVSLAEQLLFSSGSIVVDDKGRRALQQLGKVLQQNQDINVMVEGHTDNVPISRTSTYMKDNWDLSVMRATSIARILIDAGVDEERITASGRGEFVPVASNDTRENKAKNRRTEIILTPKLDELFEILSSN